MNIQGFFSAAGTAIANTASSVCGFGKYLIDKGYSACSPLASKVSEFAGRFIPNAVSNTVQAHPKGFSFIAGVGAAVVVGAVASRLFGSTPPPSESRNRSV